MSYMTGLVFAIIPAAGTGERTGLEIPKQFCHIAGHPLILHTLQCFQRSWIDTVVVAVSSDWLAYVQDLVDNHCLSNVRLVLGGETRHLSIKNCVEYVRDKVVSRGFDQSDVTVIVHDAVRPFVAEETLRNVAAAAHKQGASGVVCPLVSTTLATRPDGILDYSLVRSKHRNSHTPQAFSFSTLVTAYEKISDHDLQYGTEVLHLAQEYAGTRAMLLETEDEVWKVTYRRDFYAAEQFARERLSQVGVVADSCTKCISDVLEQKLRKKRLNFKLKCPSLSNLPADTNAVIIIKHQVTDAFIAECAGELREALQRVRRTSAPIRGCVVLYVTMVMDEPIAGASSIMTGIRELGTEEGAKDVCLHCVIESKTINGPLEMEKTDKACQLTADLILRRDELVTGQTFIF